MSNNTQNVQAQQGNNQNGNNQNGQNGDENNKTEKKFAGVIEKLTAIVRGAENLRPVKKIPGDSVSSLVEELFEEDREALYAEVKTKLKDLLRQYSEMEKALKEKRAELEKLGNQKKEEFVKSANALFDKISGVEVIQKNYYDGLKAAVDGGASLSEHWKNFQKNKEAEKETFPEPVETV